MTPEEAINLLTQVNKILVNSNSWLENTHEPLNMAFDMAIKALEQEPREAADYENEIADLHNRLDIAEYDKERLREEVTNLDTKIKALEQKPCEDAISRQMVIDSIRNYFHDEYYQRTSIQDCRDCLIEDVIKSLPPVTPQPKTGHCKDCKWWKDSDGKYRRGYGSENQCPINSKEVYIGNGYCYMFEPQESEG